MNHVPFSFNNQQEEALSLLLFSNAGQHSIWCYKASRATWNQECSRKTSNSIIFGLCRRRNFPVTAPGCKVLVDLALSSTVAM